MIMQSIYNILCYTEKDVYDKGRLNFQNILYQRRISQAAILEEMSMMYEHLVVLEYRTALSGWSIKLERLLGDISSRNLGPSFIYFI
jgi:hypothetical protein